MTSLILLNHLVPDIDILKNAIKVPYVESEQLISDIINSEPGTHELDQNIVNNISNLDSSITTIALLYENIGVIPNRFEALCASLPQHIKTIDLLTCNLNDEESITTLKTLESRYNKIIRYSVDLTGHEDSMGNWMLESDNVEVRDIYFNNKITEWKHVLIYSPETSEPLIYPDQTIYGDTDFGGSSRYHYYSNFENTIFVEHSDPYHGLVNLSDINFDYSNFVNANMTGANMYGTQFDHSDMTNAKFQSKIMAATSFYNVNLTNANFSNTNMTDVSFGGANLTNANFSNATLKNVKSGPLVGSAPSSLPSGYKFVSGTSENWIIGPNTNLRNGDLRGMDLSGINLSGANLTGADLSNVDLSGANLTNAKFSNAKLYNTILSSSNLTGANLTDADLRGANLTSADLETVNLSGATLTGTNLTNANLSGVDLSGATLTAAKSGPLDGSAPSTLPSNYNFVSGTNETWIIGPGVDLSDMDLSGMDLDGMNLSGADLSGADFTTISSGPLIGTSPSLPSNYNFVSGTHEQWIIGPNVNLTGADLSGMDLNGMNLSGVDLSGATLTGLKSGPLVGSAPSSLPSGYEFVSGTHEQWIVGPNVNLTGADLSGVDLSGMNLSGVDLSGVDLSDMNLSGVNLSGATLTGVKSGPLVGSASSSLPSGYEFVSGTNETWIIGPNVNLTGADLSGMDLNGMDLSGADLSGVTLTGVKLGPLNGSAPSLPSGYKFVSGTHEQWIIGPGVDLSGANLSGMDLSAVDLTNANLSGAKTGPLVGTSPSSLPPSYEFISGTNEQWIFGPDVDLSGADLRGMDLSNIDLSDIELSGLYTWELLGTAPTLPPDYVFVSGTNKKGIIGPGIDLSSADLRYANTVALQGEPSSLPPDYHFISGTNENIIIGPGVDLNGADLTGMNLSNIELSGIISGPLDGSAPSLPDGYHFVPGTNEKWIFGTNVDLNGADLSGMELNGIELSGI